MSLSALIQKGGLANSMTATPATSATQEADKPLTVAKVATVAVAAQPEPIPVLSPNDEANILAWLAHIKETDPDLIDGVVDKCRNDMEARRYVLKQSNAIPESHTAYHPMTCGGCIHFERKNHPNLGNCAKGEPEAIAGLWDTDRRFCGRFSKAIAIPQKLTKARRDRNKEVNFPNDFGKKIRR